MPSVRSLVRNWSLDGSLFECWPCTGLQDFKIKFHRIIETCSCLHGFYLTYQPAAWEVVPHYSSSKRPGLPAHRLLQRRMARYHRVVQAGVWWISRWRGVVIVGATVIDCCGDHILVRRFINITTSGLPPAMILWMPWGIFLLRWESLKYMSSP